MRAIRIVLAGSMICGGALLPGASAYAYWQPFGVSDPYASSPSTGNDGSGNDTGVNSLTGQSANKAPARADSCFYREPLMDKMGGVIGYRTVDGCAQ